MRAALSLNRPGSVVRLMLPLLAAMPIVAGILAIAAEHRSLLDAPTSLALLASFCAIFFTATILVASNLLARTEAVQVQAEQALRNTRDRLDAALIASEIGTWEWNVPEDRVYADPNLAAMFGVSEQDALGGSMEVYLKAIHHDDVDVVRRTIQASINQGLTFNAEYRLRGASGAERWVLARGRIIRDAAGQARRFPGVVLDISEQRRAEGRLRKSENRRRLALESAGLGMWTVEPSTMHLITDARFREVFGVQEDELDYDTAVALIHPDDRDKVTQAVTAASRASAPLPYDVEYRVCRRDGTMRWVHAKGRSNVLDEAANAESLSFDGTITDITGRKQAEQERQHILESEQLARAAAERAVRIKDEFLATLSHEIRTPLSAILGWAQLMKRSSAPANLSIGIDVIERNARAQAHIIDDLLDMSGIISGKVKLNIQDFDLSALLVVATENARPTADVKAIGIAVEIAEPRPVMVTGDPNRLQQVLWNLLSNAVKFTPQGGSIHVSLQRSAAGLELKVTDTGEGIAAEFLPFVFDRFRQADSSITRRHGGLGLGLSIVRQIAELHGGAVRVSSAGPGLGSTFVVTLPVSSAFPAGAVAAATLPGTASTPDKGSSETTPALDGIRALVVDDEPDTRDMIERMLRAHGARVVAAGSADEAFGKLQVLPFDVLLSDIGMPGEDGYSLIRRVRQLGADQGGDIPAVALTAFARAEDRSRALAAGFNSHVSKPVELGTLLETVASWARHPVT